jgi:hypothetical protein
MSRFLSLVLCSLVCLAYVAPTHALTPEQARALTQGDVDSRITALQQALTAPMKKLPLCCKPWQMTL